MLQAPPGAGKTTRVPLALLDSPRLDGRIIVLEPRRLAARAAARFMARQLGEDVGATIGYRVRHETRVSRRTRVEVVTEGVLTRMLQSDPALDGVALLIFDEFHERSIHADLGLALALQSRALLRPDLGILVMSATLAGEAVASLLEGAPIISVEGRQFDVVTHYLPTARGARIEDAVARATLRALEREPGDVLVFLPGAGEIARVETTLRTDVLPTGVEIHPLTGRLSAEQQDRAIAPAPAGRRKVVLATAIAETSLTIEGVRVVIDSGLMRVPRFSPRTGMTRLETLPVTKASADQRRGRAGRTSPGACYRLWSEHEHAGRPAHGVPEILEADLAPLALELAVRGVHDPAELRWLDAPPAAAFAQARELLAALGALDERGACTPHGRAMAELPLHPRLAHMLLRSRERGATPLACALAALLGERDIVRAHADERQSDVTIRLDALRARGTPTTLRGQPLDRAALQRARAESARLQRLLAPSSPAPADGAPEPTAGALLALAYPDRIGQRRGASRGRFLLRSGRGALLPAHDALAGEPYIVAAEVEGGGRASRIFVAAALQREEVERDHGIAVERVVAWDDAIGGVRAAELERLGAIVLRERELRAGDAEIATAVSAELRRRGLAWLSWSDAAVHTRARMAFLHALDASWPAVDDAALLADLDAWLGPELGGVRTLDALRRIDLAPALRRRLHGRQHALFDELAPAHIEVPSGSRVRIDYTDPAAPMLAVRLQEIFGWTRTPCLAGGRVPLTLRLLSPAQRPVQVTRDLASFWRSGYYEVRKDLRGRYPKHYWPDDPLTAEPTRRTRRPRG